jgi:hypothetical protein
MRDERSVSDNDDAEQESVLRDQNRKNSSDNSS